MINKKISNLQWDRLPHFSQVIATRRSDLSLSVSEVADQVGVSMSTVYYWENVGLYRLPRPVHFNALCEVLDLDPDTMYEECGYVTSRSKSNRKRKLLRKVS